MAPCPEVLGRGRARRDHLVHLYLLTSVDHGFHARRDDRMLEAELVAVLLEHAPPVPREEGLVGELVGEGAADPDNLAAIDRPTFRPAARLYSAGF